MRGEIEQIPEVVERILGESPPEIASVARSIAAAQPAWIMIAARGTSDHAAVYAQYLMETHLGLPTGLAKPSVTTIYGSNLAWRGGLLLAISQSGRSPDIVEVVTAAREAGALTLAITNAPDSPLAAAAELNLDCRAGPELAVPATKTYVAELAVLVALVAALRPDSSVAAAAPGLPDALRRAIAATSAWLDARGDAVVEAFARTDRALLVSRGYNLATSLELALKLKETCGLFAEAYSTADFAHGPLVLAGADAPTLAIRPDGEMGRLVDETVASVAQRGGRTTIIGGPEVEGREGALAIPGSVLEVVSPLVLVVPGQLLVEATARRRGIDPDSPVGLGKVTLTH